MSSYNGLHKRNVLGFDKGHLKHAFERLGKIRAQNQSIGDIQFIGVNELALGHYHKEMTVEDASFI